MKFHLRHYLDQLAMRSFSPPGTVVPLGLDHQVGEKEPVQQIVVPLSHDQQWLDVLGLHDLEILRRISTEFSIHELMMEDIANTVLIPKLEVNDHFIFVTLKILRFENEDLKFEHVAFLLHNKGMISFQENHEDTFGVIKARISTRTGRIHEKKADYLLYLLIDSTVSRFFSCLKAIDESYEQIAKARVANTASMPIITRLHHLKKTVLTLKRYVLYTHNIVMTLRQLDHPLFDPKTRKYLIDLLDQINHVSEVVETLFDDVNNLTDRLVVDMTINANETMKRLTVVTSIFMPLTLITGIYGMNFHHMPELAWHWGYFLVLGVLLAVSAILLILYRRFRWI